MGLLRAMAMLALAAGLAGPGPLRAQPDADGVQVLRRAELMPGGPVNLPHLRRLPPGHSLRFAVEFENPPPPPGGLALLLSGVRGGQQIVLNGQAWGAPPADGQGLIGGAAAIRLVPLPQPMLRAGTNRLEITLRADAGLLAMPELRIGPVGTLLAWREQRVWWAFTAPTMVAAAIGCLGLCVLLLQVRRRGESLDGYFGTGALVWALHTLWSVRTTPLLPEPHDTVWWNAVFMLYVALMIVFSLGFVGRLGPRGARRWLAVAALGPLLLYAADGFGVLRAAAAAWRLLWIAAVLGTVTVIAQHVVTRRSREGLLLLLCSAVGGGFGLHDWLRNLRQPELASVELTPYAGLMFIALVAWVLIDRFVRASRALETMNEALEARVALKGRELQQALDAMRSAKERAEAADRAKGSFLAAASHDLRQPVHALGLYVAALRNGELSPAQGELVQRMAASTAALDEMFNALLDVSRIDGAGLQPDLRPFSLDGLLQRLADAHAPAAAARGLRLSLRLAPAVRTLRAHGDPLLVERVLSNLLSNAIKYTRTGGVLLSARLRRRSQAPVWRVEVWDTGVGVPPAEAERVFDEFYQVDGPGRGPGGGMGLGLAIVRRITQRLGLPLTMHSVPGRGTRFVLDLPSTDRPPRVDLPPPPEGLLQGGCVAVVEDDPDVRHGMGVLLARWGVRVLDAADADDLARRFGTAALGDLDAVIADYRLGGGRDGLAAIARVRAMAGRALPALVVSGDTERGRIAALQAGGHDWLPKPVSSARLRSWLAQALRGATAAAGEPR